MFSKGDNGQGMCFRLKTEGLVWIVMKGERSETWVKWKMASLFVDGIKISWVNLMKEFIEERVRSEERRVGKECRP